MATSPPESSLPFWYREDHLYIVIGGSVRSPVDGDIHNVSSLDAARAWGLSTRLPNVIMEWDRRSAEHRLRLGRAAGCHTHLLVPVSSEYLVPESVILWARSRAAYDTDALQIAAETDRRTSDPSRMQNIAAVQARQVSSVDLTILNEPQQRPSIFVSAPVEAWAKMTVVPKAGSRSWARIVRKGCVGERDDQGEFSCGEYAWGCDDCPVVVSRRAEEQENEKKFGGRMKRFWLSRRMPTNTPVEIDFKPRRVSVGIDLAAGEDKTVVVLRRSKRNA